MELTWPGVPVTACAIMRPCRSKMPAERSPASRTVVEKAVRIMIWACSSTTAIRRFHMIWRWICARALVSWDMDGSCVVWRSLARGGGGGQQGHGLGLRRGVYGANVLQCRGHDGSDYLRR